MYNSSLTDICLLFDLLDVILTYKTKIILPSCYDQMKAKYSTCQPSHTKPYRPRIICCGFSWHLLVLTMTSRPPRIQLGVCLSNNINVSGIVFKKNSLHSNHPRLGKINWTRFSPQKRHLRPQLQATTTPHQRANKIIMRPSKKLRQMIVQMNSIILLVDNFPRFNPPTNQNLTSRQFVTDRPSVAFVCRKGCWNWTLEYLENYLETKIRFSCFNCIICWRKNKVVHFKSCSNRGI